MKKVLSFLFPFLLIAGFAHAADAVKMSENEMKKNTAHEMIMRTTAVIRKAHKAVSEGKVYTGDLVKAIAQQKYAISLFVKGEYLSAMNHTARARSLANAAIKANNGKIEKEEEASMESSLDEAGLDKIVVTAMPKETAQKDEDVISVKLDFDFK